MDAITPPPVNDDWRLFRAKGEAAAFGRLVKSLTDLVHSAAWRVTQEAGLAEDVTQAVFLLLAKKGRSLPAEVQPGPWCWRQAVRLATNAVRSESRRRNREQLYAAMNEPSETEEAWRALSPLLDEALAALPAADQTVIVSRYFERQDLAAVGRQMGISAEAAKKRTSRAVERLRTLLRRRGVGVTAAVLSYSLKAETVSAAPAALAGKCVKGAAAAIPAGGWPVRLSFFSTRTALAGLAAGLVLAGVCAWQWDAAARGEEEKNEQLAAMLPVETIEERAAPADGTALAKPAARLPFAEILRRLGATHWEPDTLAKQKRIAWLVEQIAAERLPDTARWMLEGRHFRQRLPLLAPVWSSWLERAPEACADFWVDEAYALSDEGRSQTWYHATFSLRSILLHGFDAARLDAWFRQRITADAGLLHAPGWKTLTQTLLRQRATDDAQVCADLLTNLPAGPGRAAFLSETFGASQMVYGKNRTPQEALDAFQAIPDPSLRHEAVLAVLERWSNASYRVPLDWWLQLPAEEQPATAKGVLSRAFVRDGEKQCNRSGVEEVLQQVPEEMRAPLVIGSFSRPNSGFLGLDKEEDAFLLPEVREYRAVWAGEGFPAQLTAAAAVSHPQLQARLLRGLYARWHEQQPAEAAAFLEHSGWSGETREMLRAAANPITP